MGILHSMPWPHHRCLSDAVLSHVPTASEQTHKMSFCNNHRNKPQNQNKAVPQLNWEHSTWLEQENTLLLAFASKKKNESQREGEGKYKKILILGYSCFFLPCSQVQSTEDKRFILLEGFHLSAGIHAVSISQQKKWSRLSYPCLSSQVLE